MATPKTSTELLKQHEHELVKTHQEFDGSSRLEYTYTAKAEAADGDPCLVTRYSYSGASSRIVFLKEYYAVWDSDWDVF